MPIPFKFDCCKNFATNVNAANSLHPVSRAIFPRPRRK